MRTSSNDQLEEWLADICIADLSAMPDDIEARQAALQVVRRDLDGTRGGERLIRAMAVRFLRAWI
jgi:hypothetical protein